MRVAYLQSERRGLLVMLKGIMNLFIFSPVTAIMLPLPGSTQCNGLM